MCFRVGNVKFGGIHLNKYFRMIHFILTIFETILYRKVEQNDFLEKVPMWSGHAGRFYDIKSLQCVEMDHCILVHLRGSFRQFKIKPRVLY